MGKKRKVNFFNRKPQPIKIHRKRVMVCIPTTGVVPHQVLSCVVNLCINSKHFGGLHTKDNCVIQDARNSSVEAMYRNGCDGILFIDSDQVFPPQGLDALVDSGKDVIGVPIVRKQPPYYPNISRYNEDLMDYVIHEDYPRNRLFKVDFIGMGFTYIKKEVFDAVEKPYFDFVWKERPAGMTNHNGEELPEIKIGEQLIGEDVYFCEKAREAGFSIWAYPMMQVGHIGDFIYEQDLHFNYNKLKNEQLKAGNIKQENGALVRA